MFIVKLRNGERYIPKSLIGAEKYKVCTKMCT